MKKQAQLFDAVSICTLIESFAPEYAAHVALTGGCLYKAGSRKDIDILFYTVRQRDAIDIAGLVKELSSRGFVIGKRHGWVLKAEFNGYKLDLFFPEAYPASSNQESTYP